MNKIIISIVVVIIVIVLGVAYSDYVGWFFRMLGGEIRHSKKLNELKNANKRSRYLKKKEIEAIVKKVDEIIKGLNYPINKEYKLDSELERKLRYSRLDNKYVTALYESISKFMGINTQGLRFIIERTSSKTETSYTGMYNMDEESITLEVSTYSTINQLVATLAHELSHHILISNKFKLEETEQNEIYTDITAIYMGFYKFFYEAYKDKSRIIYDGEFMELVDRKKLGYIGYKDVKIAEKISRKYRKG